MAAKPRPAPEGWAYYSVETPAAFRERLIPQDPGERTPAHNHEMARLEALAERHATHIHRSAYERG